MNKMISISMILGALFVLEANHTTQAASITPVGQQLSQSNIILARGGHGGGGHEMGGHPEGRAEVAPHEDARQDAGEHNVDSTVGKDVNRDVRIDNREGYYGVGGYDTLNQGCWTDSNGVQHCYGN